MRPSEMRTMSFTPRSARYLGGGIDPASGIPIATGPTPRDEHVVRLYAQRGIIDPRATSSGASKTNARPRCLCKWGKPCALEHGSVRR